MFDRLLNGVGDDPAVAFLRLGVQLKSAAAQNPRNVHAPAHLGTKLSPIPCLNSNGLIPA